MRRDDKENSPREKKALRDNTEATSAAGHVVFDFTGLEQPDVGDLSLILTARLQSALTDNVWVRSLPWETARVLKLLRLDHLFRTYPTASDDLN